jgi:hypothetical protein
MEALWTCEADSDECEKPTFNYIYTQVSHFTNDLTGNQFNLTTGKYVGYLRFMTAMFFFQ